MNEFWNVERYVDIGNLSFWHEVARILRHGRDTDESLTGRCTRIAMRDVAKYGARWRIRVVREETVFDSEVKS